VVTDSTGTHENQGGIEIIIILLHIIGVVLHRLSSVHSVKIEAGIVVLDWLEVHPEGFLDTVWSQLDGIDPGTLQNAPSRIDIDRSCVLLTTHRGFLIWGGWVEEVFLGGSQGEDGDPRFSWEGKLTVCGACQGVCEVRYARQYVTVSGGVVLMLLLEVAVRVGAGNRHQGPREERESFRSSLSRVTGCLVDESLPIAG